MSRRHARAEPATRPDPIERVDLPAPRRPSRIEQRHAQRRTAGRRRLSAALVALLLVAVAAGLATYLTSGHRSASGISPPAVAARTQRTLLLQVRGPTSDAIASALLAADRRSGQDAVVLIPNRVVAEVPGSGTAPYGQAVGRPRGAALSRSTLADLLGVTVDASWVLDQAAFASLVDRLGGIDVDVDVDVVATRGAGQVVLVPAGAKQRLTGGQALAVLAYRAPGEDELQALPRLQHVLEGLLARLPSGGAALRALVAGQGSGLQVSDEAVATAVLAGTRGDAATRHYQILPVLPIDGGGATSYRLDPAALSVLTGGVLAGSRLPGHPTAGNRVLVLNQAGGVGLGAQVRDRIVPRGFAFVDSRNQSPFDRRQTIIVVFDTTSATRARAGRLAAALGLPAAPVQVSTRAQNIADLIVIVGGDFRP